MIDNVFHAGAIVLFVALCAVASSEWARGDAHAAAAQRSALIAAQQQARAAGRLAQAPVEPARRAPQ